MAGSSPFPTTRERRSHDARRTLRTCGTVAPPCDSADEAEPHRISSPVARNAEGETMTDISESGLAAELALCPFCGAPTPHVEVPQRRAAGEDRLRLLEPYVLCMKCGGVGPSASTRSEAIAAWNRRHPPASREEGLRVKPLEWVWSEFHSTWYADSVLGEKSSRAWEISGTACVIRPGDKAGVIVGKTIEDAKSAAQEHYTNAILSAIETESKKPE